MSGEPENPPAEPTAPEPGPAPETPASATPDLVPDEPPPELEPAPDDDPAVLPSADAAAPEESAPSWDVEPPGDEPEPLIDPSPATVFAPSRPAGPSPPASEGPGETVFIPRSGPASGSAFELPPPAPPYQPRPAAESVQAAASAGGLQVEAGMVLNGIYEVRRLIARGGMGEVFEGCNINDEDDRVAIKVMLPTLAADPNVQAMFRQEARTLTKISHPAIVQYRVMAQEPTLGVFYMVMEFIDGSQLSDMLGRLQPTSQDLRALTRRLAEGLKAAHDLGAVHRDVSPDNILLPSGRLDRAKILDFGIAKDLDPGSKTIIGDGFAGKLGFVAPEQLGDFGREVGPWTDVYSLGLVILSAALGKPVNMGATMVDAVDRRRAGPDLSGAPADLRPILERMLAADPAQRLRSMDAVLAALDGAPLPAAVVGGGGPTSGKPSSPAGQGGLKPWMLIAGGGGALVLALALIAVLLLGGPKPSRQAVAPLAAGAGSAAPRAESVRRAIEAALPAIPCSWLDLDAASDTPDGVAVKLTGVAGSTTDAQAAIKQAIDRARARTADLDIGDVDQIGQPVCSALDTFRSFRADTSANGRRLSSSVTEYHMAKGADGTMNATAVINLKIGDPQQAMALFGIEQGGFIQAIIPDRSALSGAVAAKTVTDMGADSYQLQLKTDNAGWSGLLLITGASPIDAKLIAADAAHRTGDWQSRVRQAAQAGGWKAEMVWYKAIAPGA